MSIEKATTGKSSRCPNGEDCQERTGQPLQSAYRSGGVGGDGMLGRAAGVTREACSRGAQVPTLGTTSETGKAEAARAGVGVLHSSEEAPDNGVERRRGSCADADKAERERGDGPEGITTPTVPETATGIRKLQRTLYRQAKSKPKWKAWSLYGDVCRKEILEAALWQVIANGGVPGVDGVRVEDLAEDEGHRELWLARLEADLLGKTYCPKPVLRVYIPKADGKKRPLGIPTVRDRVVQTAVVFLLLPIFEADFHENSYAYRPKRRAHQAIDAIKDALLSGRREVVDADLSGYFDTIPHAELMRLVKGRVSDGSILKLVKGWLRAPVVEENPETGAKRPVKNRCGTPQGGVISPLLANLYLDGLDKAVNAGRQMMAVMVRYADDFVVLCRKGQGEEMHRRLKTWLERKGLKLNEKKTRIVDFEKESFEFLGFRLGWRKARSGRSYPHCEPSPKSCGKLREAIREETTRSTHWKEPEEVFARVNRRVRGWIGYFHYANSSQVFENMQWQLRRRMRRWLWKKHAKTEAHYGEAYSDGLLHDHYGLVHFPMKAKWKSS
jgi:group II intron reverse transcriptase/maturase